MMWIYTTSDINRPHLGSFPRKIGTRHYTLVLGTGRDGSTRAIDGRGINTPRTSVHADRIDAEEKGLWVWKRGEADAGDMLRSC